MVRSISVTETDSLLRCQAEHAFRYTGHLTGGVTLRSKVPHLRLRRGAAWGRAVAAWHETHDVAAACKAAVEQLDADAREMIDAGVYTGDVEQEHGDLADLLLKLVTDYAHRDADPLNLTDPEREVRVPVPGVEGFELHGFLDGVHEDEDGPVWIVEFKLRESLTDSAMVALGRQFRWYAWAWRELHGVEPAGVIVDERLAEVPGPVVLNKDGSPRKGQAQTSADLYLAACEKAGATPDETTVEKLRRKVWQRRHFVEFLRFELDEAGAEITSAARQVAAFDANRVRPIRNPHRSRCGSCDFRDVCPDPSGSEDLIRAAFETRVPKRERPALEVTS